MLYELVEILFKLCFNIVVAIIIIIASVSVIALVLYLVSKCFDHCSKEHVKSGNVKKDNCDNENDNNESTFWILRKGDALFLCDKKPKVVVFEGKEVYMLLDNYFYIGTEWFSEVKEENKPVRITIKIEEE
jgi:outer membrane lipoprotein-sorting protein